MNRVVHFEIHAKDLDKMDVPVLAGWLTAKTWKKISLVCCSHIKDFWAGYNRKYFYTNFIRQISGRRY